MTSRLEELENQIKTLSPREFQELRAWFAEHDAEIWDGQFQADVQAGRLDAIADRALKDLSSKWTCEAIAGEKPSYRS
jgi:hypothetical protein